MFAWAAPSERAAAELGFSVPGGFSVSLFAGDDLAHDIFSMTIDARGRVVVAGPGYVKILHDDDSDGRADRATLFSSTPKSGAHGMYFDGPNLICTGDDAVRRLSDSDGDDVADDTGEIIAHLRHPEHGANGVLRGPDGWYYVICGNDAGVSAAHAARPGSPVKEPRCGAVVRISPDLRETDVLAHGFRNPYDADFTADGRLLLVDADGERDHGLPWYAPNRLFDVAAGMEHGWLLQGWQRSWNRPASFFDNVERAVEIGRGSPTGGIVYRHRQFPARYRQGLFTACWTFGRVYFLPLVEDGATLSGSVETFLQTTGDVGFAPVDLAVGPEGDLFVAVGGRGTRGSVFRIRYEKPAPKVEQAAAIDAVLDADQPLSSWSRARWVPLARRLGREALAAATTDERQACARQIRAVEVLTELFDGVPPDVAEWAIALGRPRLSARVAWSISRHPAQARGQQILADLTRAGDARVERAAWEALAALPKWEFADAAAGPDWPRALASDCRRVRAATIAAARGPGHDDFVGAIGTLDVAASPRIVLARLWIDGPIGDSDATTTSRHVHACLDALDRNDDASARLEAIRLLQIALGDLRVQPGQAEVYSGYAGNNVEAVDAALRRVIAERVTARLPAAQPELAREAARLLAMLGTDLPEAVEAIAARRADSQSPFDDVHFLIVLSRLPAPRRAELTTQVAGTLARLHDRFEAAHVTTDRNWPLRVSELFEQLCAADPGLAEALVNDPKFGTPAHALFAAAMPKAVREKAARKLLASAAVDADGGAAWTAELVGVLAALPDDEILPRLRERWEDYALREAIVARLARRSQAVDRGRFVESLAWPASRTVLDAAGALVKLPSESSPADVAAAVAALRRYCTAPKERDVRAALAALLTHWSGRRIDVAEGSDTDLAAAYRPWFNWFAEQYPAEAARQSGFGAAAGDGAAWRDRLAKLDWAAGDAARGRRAFEKFTCSRCHAAAGRLGPDLAGAADRFSREDLFAAIIDPSRDVSPLYRTTMVTTRGGRIYHGLVVYESTDGLLLQTDADTTVRVTGDEVAGTQPSQQSLMPTGLLNAATDGELVDLQAYLKTLTPRAK